MKFKQRFLIYIIGFSVGLIILIITSRKDSIKYWMPEERVKNTILKSDIYLTTQELCYFSCDNYDKIGIINLIKESKIDFGESQTKGDDKRYSMSFKDKKYNCFLNTKDKIVELQNIDFKNANCSCIKSDSLRLFLTPNQTITKQVLNRKIVVLNKVKCYAQCYGLDTNKMKEISPNEYIESKSFAEKRPPVYAFQKKEGTKTFTFFIEMQKDQSIVQDVTLTSNEDIICKCE